MPWRGAIIQSVPRRRYFVAVGRYPNCHERGAHISRGERHAAFARLRICSVGSRLSLRVQQLTAPLRR
jgi:hypothetical protein